MRRVLIIALSFALLNGMGCSCLNVSKTQEPTMDQQLKKHGMFSWSELMTTDVEAAKVFYAKLFGWSTEDVSAGGMPYTMVKVDGKEVGGIMSMPPEAHGAPPNWGVYVTVNDVDAIAKLAESLGARLLVPPQDIPDVGRFCVIQDPQGAVVAAITYAVH